MFTIIENVLTEQQLGDVKGHLSQVVYEPGYKTAGKRAHEKKHNLQADLAATVEAEKIIMSALSTSLDFNKATFWKNINKPLFSMYLESMGYEDHTDDPIMRKPRSIMRTDLSMTLFLNEPEQYDGGELCINAGTQFETQHKLPAGWAIIYPSDTTHCVMEVTHGFRSAMVTWIQSFIQDHEKRRMVTQLMECVDQYHDDRLEEIYGKLVRMWADV